MNKTLTALIVFSSVFAYAQQDPYYTHFKDITEAYNPAGAGEKEAEICLSGLTHHQWRDYDDATGIRGTSPSAEVAVENVAPVTYNFNVSTQFGIGKANNQFIGAGLSIIDDKIGYTKSTAIMANLNYKRQFQRGFNEIAVGVGIGSTQWGYDNPKYIPRDALDPNIPASGQNQSLLDLNFGVMYKQDRLGPFTNWYTGLSATNLTSPSYEVAVVTMAGTQTTMGIDYIPHFYGLVGGDIVLPANNLVLEPAILGKFGSFNPKESFKPQFDMNVTALFSDTYRGGIAYRQWATADAISLLVGFKKEALEVGYSYDITVSNIQKVSNGTHEIVVKYCIPIKVKPAVPLIRLTPRFL